MIIGDILKSIVDLTVALHIRKTYLYEDEAKISELHQLLDKKIDEYEEEMIELAKKEGHKRAIQISIEYEILLNKMIEDEIKKLSD